MAIETAIDTDLYERAVVEIVGNLEHQLPQLPHKEAEARRFLDRGIAQIAGINGTLEPHSVEPLSAVLEARLNASDVSPQLRESFEGFRNAAVAQNEALVRRLNARHRDRLVTVLTINGRLSERTAREIIDYLCAPRNPM